MLEVSQPAVVYVDVGKEFTMKYEFKLRDHMLKKIHAEAAKFGFGIIFGRIDFGFDKILTFNIMRCERCGEYKDPLEKLKSDDIRTNKL